MQNDSNLHDQITKLEREITGFEAARNKPHVTSISPSGSSSSEPPWSKTPQQIELESQLAELRRRQGTAMAKEEGEPDSDEGFSSKGEQAPGEEPDAPEQTSTIEQSRAAPLPDPLAPARDRGVRLQDVIAFTWPGGSVPYVSVNLGRLLRIAATRLDHERILRPHQVFDALLHREIGESMVEGSPPRVFLPRIAREYSPATPTQLGQFEFPSETTIAANAGDVIVGPEMVAILLRMSLLREKTNNSFLEGGVRHFLAALVLEEIGRVASERAGLNFVSWRDTLAQIVQDEIKNYVSLGDNLDSWRPIIDEMRQVSLPPRTAGETHAFANDRTEADLLNTGSDAAALADLLLLDDLKPPVAVGVFGPWGSGKSTLIRLLKDQITERTSQKANMPMAPKVVQINFDAWSHADAENLWASLTAELFDQLADAIEPDGKLRAGLITEIAKRLRKDAEASPLAEGAIEDQREVVQAAETKLASLEHEPVATTVAGEMANELIAKATPKELSDEDKKDPNKRREAEKAEANKKHLDELLQACGVPTGERDPEKLASLLSGLFDLPGRAALLFVLLRRSVGLGVAYGLTAALATLIIGAGGAVWLLGWGRVPEIWTYIVGALPSLAVLGALIGTAGIAIRTATPILSLAAEFLARKEKRAAELNKERREAAELVKNEREKLDTMVAEQKKVTEFAASYSVAAEGRSREGLLRYFITYSPELAEVRKKLGLLATIRRCFETLEQIMHEKRGATPAEAKPAEGNSVGDKPAADKAADLSHVPDVRRIIVYIDDLDRCSEQHVVQVLQAIHLLLAFDLFVVVVAVDARWLHRAVGKIYSGQLAAPKQPDESDQTVQAEGATVADYLEKIFQLPIWMQPIGNPPTVEAFVNGIDEPQAEPAGPTDPTDSKKGDHQGREIVPIDAKPDPALLQTAAQRRATMSKIERRAPAAMAPLAGKSPRGLKRLVNTYRLTRVMRGSTGIADLEAGSTGKTPLYPYLLFALACEVGLTTETAALVAEVAGRNLPDDGLHPLVTCLFPDDPADEGLDDTQTRLRERLDAEGMRAAVLTAVHAVYVAAAGGDPLETRVTDTGLDNPGKAPQREDKIFVDRKTGSERFAQAFAEAARFTFRPRNR